MLVSATILNSRAKKIKMESNSKEGPQKWFESFKIEENREGSTYAKPNPKPKNKPRKLPNFKLRYVVSMILLTTYNIGGWYINDYPSELGQDFMRFFNVNPDQVQFYYQIYSFPAIVVVLLSGFIISKFDATKVAAFSGSVVFLTIAGFFISTLNRNFTILLASQCLYGSVGEILTVAQNTLLTQTFNENGQTIGFGLSQGLNTLFETASNYFNPKLFAWTKSMPLVYFLGVVFQGLSTLSCLVWMVLEKCFGWGSLKRGKDWDEVVQKRNEMGSRRDMTTEILGQEQFDQMEGLTITQKMQAWWIDIKDPMVTLNILITSINQYIYLQVMTFLTESMVIRFNLKLEQANQFVALMLFLTIPSAQLYPNLAVAFGRRPSMLIFGNLCLGAFFLLFLLLPAHTNPSFFYLTSLIFSQFYSISTAIGFSCIGIVTPPRTVSAAYGLVSFLYNTTFCIVPYFIGRILKDNTPAGYQKVNLIMLCVTLVGLTMAIGIKVIDIKRGGLLAMAEKKRETTAIFRVNNTAIFRVKDTAVFRANHTAPFRLTGQGDAYLLNDDGKKVSFDDDATTSLQPTFGSLAKSDGG